MMICPAEAGGPANGVQAKARGVTISDQLLSVPVSPPAWSEASTLPGAQRARSVHLVQLAHRLLRAEAEDGPARRVGDGQPAPRVRGLRVGRQQHVADGLIVDHHVGDVVAVAATRDRAADEGDHVHAVAVRRLEPERHVAGEGVRNAVDADVDVGDLEVVGDGLRVNHAARPQVLNGQRAGGRARVGDGCGRAARRADAEREGDSARPQRAGGRHGEIERLAAGDGQRDVELEGVARDAPLRRDGGRRWSCRPRWSRPRSKSSAWPWPTRRSWTCCATGSSA